MIQLRSVTLHKKRLKPSINRWALLLLCAVLSGCSVHNHDVEESSKNCPAATTAKSGSLAAQPLVLNDTKSCDSCSDDEDPDEESDDDEENEDEEDDAEIERLLAPTINFAEADPWEKLNRAMYGAHRFLDLLFVRPVALTYSKVLPKPVRYGLANFVSTLTAPLRMLCHLLQGNFVAAGKTAGKFTTNLVFGFGGTVNVAEQLGLKETPTGFTETLKKWGAKPGPYVVVPGVGPTTLRGAIGFLFDSFLDPVFLLTLSKDLPKNSHHELMYADSGVQLSGMLIARSQIDALYDSIEKNATNRYSKLRAVVLQQSINK